LPKAEYCSFSSSDIVSSSFAEASAPGVCALFGAFPFFPFFSFFACFPVAADVLGSRGAGDREPFHPPSSPDLEAEADPEAEPDPSDPRPLDE
jgi:hypothetical protein